MYLGVWPVWLRVVMVIAHGRWLSWKKKRVDGYGPKMRTVLQETKLPRITAKNPLTMNNVRKLTPGKDFAA